MSKITSIGTALPAHKHRQQEILNFMQLIYAGDAGENRKLRFLYQHSGIDYRYSVIPDYCRDISEWKFYPQSENIEPFPSIEQRMTWFNRFAPSLSVAAIRDCINEIIPASAITHLITVSCTGMSAPGLDLQIMDAMDLPRTIHRTSVNFMGCYAAIHALKMADAICEKEPDANVVIVCTELCTLHFQKERTPDAIASALLFGDGVAAALVTSDDNSGGLRLDHFYSEVISKGKKDMAWELSSTGFQMTLSGYVPELIEEDFAKLVDASLGKVGLDQSNIAHWCIHPGGKRILEAIQKALGLRNGALDTCFSVLKDYGNMSSATILFVLRDMMKHSFRKHEKIFGAAFGPGLTMETFVATVC